MTITITLAIAEKFRFEYPLCDEVKKVDEDILQEEWNRLMIDKYKYDHSFKEIEHEFLTTFSNLKK